jgi:hypothetical protein
MKGKMRLISMTAWISVIFLIPMGIPLGASSISTVSNAFAGPNLGAPEPCSFLVLGIAGGIGGLYRLYKKNRRK